MRRIERQRSTALLTCALPPIRAMKMQIHKENWAAPSSLIRPLIHPRPKCRERIVFVHLFGQERKATLIEVMHE
jgi:hypothetical protein